MSIQNLYLEQFRNIKEANVVFDGRKTNILVGENRSGKTSVLEAINFLLNQKSFKTNKLKELVTHETDRCRVEGSFTGERDLVLKSKILLSKEGLKSAFTSTDKEEQTLNRWVTNVPSMFINADVGTDISGPSQQRRKLFDWGVFHVEHDFGLSWANFNKILKQRNAYLRNWKGSLGLQSWDKLFCEYSEKISRKREEYITELSPLVNDVFSYFSKQRVLKLSYSKGWSDKKPLNEVLIANKDSDRNSGYTHQGPHRYEVNISADNLSCKQYSSRGEQKLIAYCIRIAQAILLGRTKPNACIILCDDFHSELDSKVGGRLLEFFSTIPQQVILTSSMPANNLGTPSDHQLFHVEQGKIRQTS